MVSPYMSLQNIMERCQKVTFYNPVEGLVGGDEYAESMFKWLRNAAIERELTEILDRHQQVRRDANDIRDYLLWVLEEDRNGGEKFSDAALNRAAELNEQVGAGALYWMTDIAAQMVVLAEASLRGFPTNVSLELGATATAEEIVKKVVQLP
jgi:hypothetical protein